MFRFSLEALSIHLVSLSDLADFLHLMLVEFLAPAARGRFKCAVGLKVVSPVLSPQL